MSSHDVASLMKKAARNVNRLFASLQSVVPNNFSTNEGNLDMLQKDALATLTWGKKKKKI